MARLCALVVCFVLGTAAPLRAGGEVETPAPPPAGAAAASPANSIELFLAPVSASGDERAAALVPVLTSVVQGLVAGIDEVKLTCSGRLPELDRRFARAEPLLELDRLALIEVKNQSGVDGVIFMELNWRAREFSLRLRLFDLRNGRLVEDSTFSEPVSAALFARLEQHLRRFAVSIRRSIRVTVSVTSEPAGSEVLVNDRPQGSTPLTLELRTGSYRIEVRRPGHKPYRSTHQLTDGDRLELHAVLYNPIANRFLNAPPGLRVDSRGLGSGYRYLFVNSSDPELRHLHFTVTDAALRINDFELGLRLAYAAATSHQLLDTFLGEQAGDFALEHQLLQVMALARYPLWEKYSFANLKAVLAAGFTYAAASSAARHIDKWTGCLDVGLEAEVRLVRLGNLSLDLMLSLGFSYLGEVSYLDKEFSPFGEGPERVRNKHLFGPAAGAGLQLKWYNDIF